MKFEWKEVELAEIADLTVGFVGTMARHYTDKGVLFLRSTNIEPFNIKMDDIKYISPEFNEQIKKSELKTNDVVIVRTGKPGACTVIPPKDEPWNCSDLVVIHPNKEKVNPHYLAAYINLASGVINAHLVGAVQQHFNVGAAKKMKVRLPPLEIQNKIASIIQGINSKIELNNKINDNLEQQAFTLFEKLQLDAYGVECQVSDIAYLNPKRFLLKNQMARCIDMSQLSTSGMFPSGWEFKPFNGGMRFANSDTLLARITPCLENGKAAYINFLDEREIAFGSTEYIVLSPKEGIPPEFLYCLARYPSFIDFATKNMNGTSGRQRVSADAIGKFVLCFPTKNALDEFGNVASVLFSKIKNNSFENLKLAALRDTLLPKLMSGKIEV